MFIFLMVGSSSIQAQILKNVTGTVKDAGNTATNPVKDVRGTVKDISKVPNDIKNAKRDIVRPAQDLQKEVDGLGNDISKAKNDVNGMRGGRQASKEEQAKQDSLAAADKVAKQLAYEKEKARRDSVSKSKQRTGIVIVDEGDAPGDTETLTTDPSRTVLLPPSTIKGSRPTARVPRTRTRTGNYGGSTQGGTRTRTTSGGNTSTAASAGGSNSNTTRPTRVATSTTRGDSPMSSNSMKYAGTPAKRYLERADFDEGTLDDLFDAAIWTGPDSVHTARSIDYMLQQYRMDLDEVKRIDPNFDVDGREDRYRKWSGLYYRNTRPLKED